MHLWFYFYVSVNNLSSNKFFDIKVWMLFWFWCFLLFLNSIIASNINVSNCFIAVTWQIDVTTSASSVIIINLINVDNK